MSEGQDNERSIARRRALERWARQDPVQELIRGQIRSYFIPLPSRDRPEEVRVCGHCGDRIHGEACTRCAWDRDTLTLLTCHPSALPTCPYCFHKPMPVHVYTVGAIGEDEAREHEIRDVPWCLDEGRCSRCGKSGFQWQRDMLLAVLRDHFPLETP